MDRKREMRRKEIAAAVADTRAIEKRDGVSGESLEKIKQRLIGLARPELFPASGFAPPKPGGKLKSCLYRVSEDEDHRFALYVNRFYDRTPEGPPGQKGESVVKQGTGVCFLPEDLHSIHIQAPLTNFHLYGLALDQLRSREYYKSDEKTWRIFPAHSDIREAR